MEFNLATLVTQILSLAIIFIIGIVIFRIIRRLK